MSPKTRRTAAVASVVAFVATTGAALAFPVEKNVISACVGGGGQLRVVKSTDQCEPEELPLTWNQQGPAGVAGPAGADGISCWDGDGSGACELAVEDRDGNGQCDALDCRAAGTASVTVVHDAPEWP